MGANRAMNVLYIGDVMAEPGMRAVTQILPEIKAEYKVDFVIAQAENANKNGKGATKDDIAYLQEQGVDFFTGGNHSLANSEATKVFEDPSSPVVRPANLPHATGRGYRIVTTAFGNVLIASMLGQTVGRPIEIENPLTTVDRIMSETKNEPLVARIINLHGDFSSEKRVFGYYLDGQFSMVVGDHWHVPTADAMILPKGTAHITDVGMCGTVHSSLGVTTEVIIDRWKHNATRSNEIETNGPLQFNAVLVTIDTATGLSTNITQIQRTIQA
jgi:2',3'-cyclic-nucleotide 2'-phosphodiesterase